MLQGLKTHDWRTKLGTQPAHILREESIDRGVSEGLGEQVFCCTAMSRTQQVAGKQGRQEKRMGEEVGQDSQCKGEGTKVSVKVRRVKLSMEK